MKRWGLTLRGNKSPFVSCKYTAVDEYRKWIKDSGFKRTEYASDERVQYLLEGISWEEITRKKMPLDELFYGIDHCHAYQDENGYICALTHPYMDEDGEAMFKWCAYRGIKCMKLPVSWYYPGETVAFLLWVGDYERSTEYPYGVIKEDKE